MKLSDVFQSKAQVRLLEYFLENAGAQRVFNQAVLANLLGLSPSTIARIVEPLVKEKIILYERFDKGMKIFTLNEAEEKTKALIDFHKRLKEL
ncbi:MAG: winged helix-turn-helix domain-containing protein [Candidatus Bathyarchaeia archaeon]|jgi:DNA-binding MarR family transcriptional regulator